MQDVNTERRAAETVTPDLTDALNEYGPLHHVVLRDVRAAYGDQQRLDRLWQAQEFQGAPDFAAALAEYEAFHEILADSGARIDLAPPDERVGLASIYSRDSSIVASGGTILCRMRNAYRGPEPAVAGAFYDKLGIPVLGAITGSGTLEGGDFVWFDAQTCAVAEGYRTNAEGIRQLKALLGPGVHVAVVPLPHHQGPDACLHLMSIISPVDADLAVVYSPLMAVPFRDWLLDRGIQFVEVPDEEFEPTMACNVLALGPRKCVMIEGSPKTRARLEAAGCEVIPFKGQEISIKGAGGPTCLTRPICRG